MFLFRFSCLSLLVFGDAVKATNSVGALRLLSNQEKSCDLMCPSDAPCRFGSADFSGHKGAGEETHRNNMHCDCPIGWTGILCDKKYETCTNQDGHECYNGGECIFGLQDKYGNEQLFCDCSKARGYVGKYCETPYAQTCGDEEVYCVNGGDCNLDFPDFSSEPCLCDEGWEGKYCQYKKDEVPACTLDCQNGGFCFVGAGDEIPSNQRWSIGEETDQHMYCECPPSFGGALCEAPAEYCGKGNGHVCLNGGTCVTTSVKVSNGMVQSQHRCDCTTATNENNDFFAGKYCEHKSTSVCDVESEIYYFFCTQGGACTSKPMDGCSCRDGTIGFRCEYVLDSYVEDSNIRNMNDDDDYFSSSRNKVELSCDGGYCLNGGSCVTEQIVKQDGTSKVEEYCDCSEAYSANGKYAGDYCQYLNHKEEGKGGDIDEDCGGRICHNGGKCMTAVIFNAEIGTSETSYACDCSTAYDDETAYLGELCEYPSTDFCTPPKSGKPLSSARFCVNHGTCSEGPSNDCECGDGFVGSSCERKIDLDNSDKDFDEEFGLCRDGLVCFNGGECATTIETGKNGVEFELSKCDCGSVSNGADIFAGISCEYKATSICGTSFCVNGGKCNENGVCDCSLPWVGKHCQFMMDGMAPINYQDERSDSLATNGNPFIDCNLKCMNGGVCVQGAKDLGVFQDSIKDVAHLNQTYAEDEFAHCACSSGWIGLTCENKVEVCGDIQHFCLHGSKCISDTNADRGYSCDCSQANDSIGDDSKTHVFGGDSCQYADMDICTIGSEYLGQPLYFCVNGGSCNARVMEDEPDPGCTCPDNYIGPHCEVNAAVDKNRASSSDVMKLSLIAGLLVALLGILAFVASYTRSLIFTGRKNGTATTGNADIPTTRTPFSPRRRRKAGFGKSKNQKSSVSDTTDVPPSSTFADDVDTTASGWRVEENEGVMKDCSLDDESPYGNNKNSVEFLSQDDDCVGNKVRGSQFV